MLKAITLLMALLAAASLCGQITLTNTYFPVAGDTLRYGTAGDDFSIDQLTPGPNRQWDFGTQVAVSTSQQIYAAASDSIFTEADLTVTLDSLSTAFVATSETSFDLIGLRGTLDAFPGTEFSAPISPARPDRRAPLAYEDTFTSQTENRIAIARTDLSQELLDQAGNLFAAVDSVRITASSDRTSEVDAYGSLTLNGRTYNVLRERRTESIVTKIEALVLGTYADFTSQIRALFPESADLLDTEEPVTTYYYWSDSEKESIATVTEEDGEETQMTFIRSDATNSSRDYLLGAGQVNVYPNPARGGTTFTVAGIDPGTYTLRMVNVLGRQVSLRQFTPVAGRAKVEVDVSQLPRGTYLYSLINERGRILTTRRLLVGH